MDLAISISDENILLTLTNDGKLYNPFVNEELLKQDSIKEFNNLNYTLNYDELLGFNKMYFKLDNVNVEKN